jgi:hypothetical protein
LFYDPAMPQIRPLPIVCSVVACEVVLALIGSEVNYQASRHQLSNSGAVGVLLESVGAPLTPPWRGALWREDGLISLIGLVLYLALLAGAVCVIARGSRPDRAFSTLFVGTWGTSVLTLMMGQFVRLVLTGDQLRIGGWNSVRTALTYAPSFLHHGLYFGWIPAAIAATVATLTRSAYHPDRERPDQNLSASSVPEAQRPG